MKTLSYETNEVSIIESKKNHITVIHKKLVEAEKHRMY